MTVVIIIIVIYQNIVHKYVQNNQQLCSFKQNLDIVFMHNIYEFNNMTFHIFITLKYLYYKTI